MDHLLEIVFDLADLEAELLGALELVEELGVLEEGLGGDAAPVEAGAARPFLLDDGDFLAELGRPDRAHVTSRTAADNH